MGNHSYYSTNKKTKYTSDVLDVILGMHRRFQIMHQIVQSEKGSVDI